MKTLFRILKSVLPARSVAVPFLDAQTIARRYGHGNVKIQLGHVMTNAQYEARRAQVLAYEF